MKFPIKIWLAATLLISASFTNAEDFNTSFESINVSTIDMFSITDHSHKIIFNGGTAFTIGNGSLYRTGIVSWMIDVPGTTERGTSDGTGVMTFEENPSRISFYIRTSSAATTVDVSIIDTTNATAHEVLGSGNADWTLIEYEIIDGDPEISSVEITVTGAATEMAAIDDVTFTPAGDEDATDDVVTGDNSSSDDNDGGIGSFNWFILSLLFMIGVQFRRKLN